MSLRYRSRAQLSMFGHVSAGKPGELGGQYARWTDRQVTPSVDSRRPTWGGPVPDIQKAQLAVSAGHQRGVHAGSSLPPGFVSAGPGRQRRRAPTAPCRAGAERPRPGGQRVRPWGVERDPEARPCGASWSPRGGIRARPARRISVLVLNPVSGGKGGELHSGSTSGRPTRRQPCLRDGRAEVATLGTRSLEIPSVVLLREDGVLLIGEPAERRSLIEPGRFAREFKRRIGDPTPVLLGGSPFSAHSLMAHLLRGRGQGGGRSGGRPARPHGGDLPRQLGRVQARAARPGARTGRHRYGERGGRARGGRGPLRVPPPGCSRARWSRSTTSAAARSTPRSCATRATGSSWWAIRGASSRWAASTSTRPCSPGWSATWGRRLRHARSRRPADGGGRVPPAARVRRGQGDAVVGHRHGHPRGPAQPSGPRSA